MGTEEVEIKANYEVNTHTITTKTNDGGVIAGNTTVNYNDNATFTITPNTGYGIVDVKVDGTSVGAKTSYEFKNVVKNHTIEVVFGVTTEESFRTAVAQGGVVYLASDLTLSSLLLIEDNAVEIVGNGHEITFEGGTFETNVLACSTGAKLTLRELAINRITIVESCSVTLFDCEVYNIFNARNLDTSLTIYSGVYRNIQEVNQRPGKFNGSICALFGGTYYFDASAGINSETHKTTQTKDDDGNDIWVVTEK